MARINIKINDLINAVLTINKYKGKSMQVSKAYDECIKKGTKIDKHEFFKLARRMKCNCKIVAGEWIEYTNK